MQEFKFEQKNADRWNQFDALLEAAEKDNKFVDVSQIPDLLQKQSADLSIARHRMYGSNMCEYLNAQVIRGFKLVQKGSGSFWANLITFLLFTFPRAVRKEWKLHLLCWFACIFPGLIVLVLGANNMDWINGILGPDMQASMDSMYGKGPDKLDRGEGGDFYMFTHYINNNISIDFQIFASGILGGLGSLYYLFYNSIYFGAVVAYIQAYGDPTKLYGFVSSHAPYEFWAMVISGMAGVKMGFALLMPGRRTRVASLKHAGKTSIPLILGAASMTFLAAIIEGFWSANEFAAFGGWRFKVWVGAAGWLLLIAYFSFAGRGGRRET